MFMIAHNNHNTNTLGEQYLIVFVTDFRQIFVFIYRALAYMLVLL